MIRGRQGLSVALCVLVFASSLSTLLSSTLACSENSSKPPVDDTNFKRRVFRPPPKGAVRAVPPHNIHGQGVGPYELGASFQTTLSHLSQSPQVEIYKAEGLFDYRLMRTDNDALVIGIGRRGGVSFVAVLDPDIARTESGVGVGAGVKELIGALGEIQATASGGRDKRVIVFSSLANARFILEQGKVVAALVVPSPNALTVNEPTLKPTAETENEDENKNKNKNKNKEPPQIEVDPSEVEPTGNSASCLAEALEARRKEILRFARWQEKEVDELLLTCLLSDKGEVVLRSGNTVKVIGQTPNGDLRSLGESQISGLNFVAVLDTGGERPELFSVSQRHSILSREVVVARHPIVSNLAQNWSQTVFQLRALEASWIGAELKSADFLIELSGGDSELVVSGIYTQKQRGILRHIVPVDPVTVPIQRPLKKQAPPVTPAEDAGVAVVDSSGLAAVPGSDAGRSRSPDPSPEPKSASPSP